MAKGKEQHPLERYIGLLGQRARDRVTGIEGIVITVGFDLFGCVQAIVQPRITVSKDGDFKKPDSYWLDVNRLEITDANRVMNVPAFDAPMPSEHKAGPSDKPAGRW